MGFQAIVRGPVLRSGSRPFDSTPQEFFVLTVWPYPEPQNSVRRLYANGAVT